MMRNESSRCQVMTGDGLIPWQSSTIKVGLHSCIVNLGSMQYVY